MVCVFVLFCCLFCSTDSPLPTHSSPACLSLTHTQTHTDTHTHKLKHTHKHTDITHTQYTRTHTHTETHAHTHTHTHTRTPKCMPCKAISLYWIFFYFAPVVSTM